MTGLGYTLPADEAATWAARQGIGQFIDLVWLKLQILLGLK